MSHDANDTISFKNVSKFYGEVLGINRINIEIPSGITSLVGPNGSGKTTLMNLMTGLLQPSQGEIRVLGHDLHDPENVFRRIGYCTQYDSFPLGITGWDFLYTTLRIHGHTNKKARELAELALDRVDLSEAANRRIAGYSKGMRQRIKLAQAICHKPTVLVLDEPLNGLDPQARSEVIGLFRDWSQEGRHLIISSHILHEVDMISDQVVILTSGYVVAEGDVRGMRSDIRKPLQIMVRCDKPEALAARLFADPQVVEVAIHDDRSGLHVRTKDADGFYQLLNKIVLETELTIEQLEPSDDDIHAVYEHLVGTSGESR